MTAYTVASDGTISPSTPSFPSTTLNDSLTPDGSFDTTSATGSTVSVYLDGTFQLQSLFIGPALEVDLGDFSSASISGTGSITGSNDATNIPPAFVSNGAVDINGAIDIAFTSNGQLTVSSGERLDVEGDLNPFSAGASSITVAATGEFDINSQSIARLNALSSQGTLKITAPNTYLSSTTTLGGTVLVQGDALNGIGSGTLAARSIGAAYVATLDLRQAALSAAISNLTLGTDAAVHFGSTATTVQRFAVAGSSTAMQPLDLVTADGALTVSGNGSGAANQVSIGNAEFAGGTVVDFTVAASDGGASLQQQITVDAGTTLRNDGRMTIGGSSTTATTLGASAAAAGSSFINGSGAQLTLAAGAALSVAALQNAGAITVAGNVTVQQALTNTGTIDVTAGKLALAAAVPGSGTITVESGATLSIAAATSQTVALRNGSQLQLSQPSTFTGTLQAPAIGASIDLVGITANSATVANGVINVATTSGSYNIAETGLLNGTTLAVGTDGSGGSLLSVDASDLTHPVAYRFFDSVHGTQFLTTSLGETQSLQATRPDLVYEGIGLAAANQVIDSAAAPVFRFFDTKFGTHFYTDNANERDTVLATRPDLLSEGIGFYEHVTAQPGDVAVYRFFDSNFGTHFYTASATERATVVATRPDLISEGIGFYAPSNTMS